jgi:hypothetical protein
MKAAQGTGDEIVSASSARGAVTSVTATVEDVIATRGVRPRPTHGFAISFPKSSLRPVMPQQAEAFPLLSSRGTSQMERITKTEAEHVR